MELFKKLSKTIKKWQSDHELMQEGELLYYNRTPVTEISNAMILKGYNKARRQELKDHKEQLRVQRQIIKDKLKTAEISSKVSLNTQKQKLTKQKQQMLKDSGFGSLGGLGNNSRISVGNLGDSGLRIQTNNKPQFPIIGGFSETTIKNESKKEKKEKD